MSLKVGHGRVVIYRVSSEFEFHKSVSSRVRVILEVSNTLKSSSSNEKNLSSESSFRVSSFITKKCTEFKVF